MPGATRRDGSCVDGGRIWRWLAQLGSALQYLHARRILHRDLKTENVFLDADDDLKLGDFGIARSLSTQTALAATVVGTPAYMSPEVINSDEYGEPADAWAVGVILYELIALERPFDGTNLATIVMKISRGAADVAKLEASGHAKELCWLATNEALLHADGGSRMTVGGLIEYVAREQMHAAAAEETASV